MARSGYTRGSTVDLTLISSRQKIYPLKKDRQILKDGREITFLNDEILDMEADFNLFDSASHHDSTLVAEIYQA